MSGLYILQKGIVIEAAIVSHPWHLVFIVGSTIKGTSILGKGKSIVKHGQCISSSILLI